MNNGEISLKEVNFFSLLTLVGIMFVLTGIILIILPLIIKIGIELEKIHPLLLVWRKIDGFYIGTSPILLIVLAIVYLLTFFLKKP